MKQIVIYIEELDELAVLLTDPIEIGRQTIVGESGLDSRLVELGKPCVTVHNLGEL
jgi:hypothetical protein